MNWLRNRLRKWLGIEKDYEFQSLIMRGLQAQLKAELAWRTEFTESLRAKAKQPARAVPRYTDYESSQMAALQEFEEKPNGVHS